MREDRREFLKRFGWWTATGTGLIAANTASASEHAAAPKDPMGVLVDLTQCIGCRRCEGACKESNGFDPGPDETYDDKSVYEHMRRPAPDSFTVVNRWENPADADKPIYAKVNCLHCNHPACVSACIVGALRKQEHGAVTYDAWKCIGCRYCMVACPFQIPAYSYDDAFAPRVLKCQFCFHKTKNEGELPACVAKCPREVMVYARRSELLELAERRIREHPGRYVSHIYGAHEVGGTSWMYLSAVPFEQVGFLKLASWAPPALTEKIQHGVFKHGLPPLILYGTLGALMYVTGRRKQVELSEAEDGQATGGELRPALAMAASGDGMALEVMGRDAVVEWPMLEGSSHPAPHSTLSRGHPGEGTHSGHHEEEPMPVERKLLTPGVWMMLGLIAAGLAFGVYRFIRGIGAATNLDQQWPWGLWIAVDVASGVALAAGGFTSAFLTHVLHREKYHAVARPALLTAMLGYTFVCLGLQADLGRYYNVWHPMIMWQGNSVLFEVGMCVMCYLNVLYLEFAPIVCERLIKQKDRLPRLARLASWANPKLEKIMFLLVIAGCVLSCLHQSSLGTLLVIAPSKLHPLWWTPWSPLMFLLSAIAVGFPMVIWESLFAGWSLKLKPEMNVLGPLGRFIPLTLGVYLTVKLADMVHRGTYVYLSDGSLQSICWLIEIVGGVVLPLVMFATPAVRRSPKLLFIAATLVVVVGVLFNRVNVFLVGYRPPYTKKIYVPSIGEFAVTIGLIACLMFIYRVVVTYLPVISQPKGARA